jgi:transposase InsO family protein
VTTGWSEAVAVLGRSALVMEDGFRRALSRLPFVVHEIHTDNGSEFFTAHLARFFEQLQAQRSRSRPYRKNDARWWSNAMRLDPQLYRP